MVAMRIGGSTHPDAACVLDEATLHAVLRQDHGHQIIGGVPPLFEMRSVTHQRGEPALLVGVHGTRGVLWWSHPAERLSQFSAEGTNADFVLYQRGGQEQDIPPRTELPLHRVLAAAAEFLATGTQPRSVEWINEDDAVRPAIRHAS